MIREDHYLRYGIILLIAMFILMSGCVEVTPPTGTQNASSYGPAGTGGNLTSGLDARTPTPTPTDSSSSGPVGTQEPVSGSSASQSTESNVSGPQGKIPAPPVAAVVQVTPRSYEGLPTTDPTQSYSAKTNTSVIGPGKQFVNIYEINHSFSNDAVAYTYNLVTPPLYIDLEFNPVLGTDVISYQKRTGNKDGQIDVTVNRPLKDAWFEMRVYNLKDGSEVMREGFGKTYSQDNKSVSLLSSGSYQFDFVGNQMNATIILKVPMSEEALRQYQNVTGMLTNQKQESGLIPNVFLLLSDLPAQWVQAGDIVKTDSKYQSIFVFPASGYKLDQKIQKFTSPDAAKSALESLKTAASGENPAVALVGQSGFQYESVRKSELAFIQGYYLVDLVSYSVPPVPISELQRYGGIIVSRINA